MALHARRWLTPKVAIACTTAARLATGVTIFLRRCPSGSRCPASSRPAASSACCSRPPAPSDAGHPRHPCPVLRLPLVERRAADAVLAADLVGLHSRLVLPQDRDDLLLAEPR